MNFLLWNNGCIQLANTAVAIAVPIIVAVVCLGLGFVSAIIYRHYKDKRLKINLDKEIATAKLRAERLVNSAKADLRIELATFKLQAQKDIEAQQKKLRNYEDSLDKRESSLLTRSEKIDQQFQDIAHRKSILRGQEDEYQLKLDKALAELEKISGFSQEEARNVLISKLKRKLNHELTQVVKNYENETRLNAKEIANEIILDAMNRFATDVVTERTVSQVKLPNEEMKGRIIGKEGRNIRALEAATGVDFIIEDSSDSIQVSSFNPVRREVAVRSLKKLIRDGRIQPVRIEEVVAQVSADMESSFFEIGKKISEELAINDIDPKLISYIGRLKFRTSYGQNALQHSVEVAKLASHMAAELGLDANLARRAGLLHDIGKAIDYELEGTHVQLGLQLVKKFGESKIVQAVIAEHHGDEKISNFYTSLIMTADTLSAARPAARNDSYEEFIQRMQAVEEICMAIEEVKQAYALQAGRQIRVFVNPWKANDLRTRAIAETIKSKIKEAKLPIPGEIVIDVIRQFHVKARLS